MNIVQSPEPTGFNRVVTHYKGVVIKLGQMLGHIDRLELPDTARAMLTSLRGQSPPTLAAAMRGVIQAELGAAPELLFAEWEDAAFASASLGELHRARLHHADIGKGTRVAVKVQYPGIEAAIRADLRSTRVLARALRPMAGPLDTHAVAHELCQRVIEVSDYAAEARVQQRMANLFADDEQLHVPLVVSGYSSKRVLTTELFTGQGFAEFAASATQAQRNEAGVAIFRAVFVSIFRHRLFHCDPQPGNFAFGGGRVALLDFGSVRECSAELVEGWKLLINAVLDDDLPRFRDAMLAMNLVQPQGGFDYEAQLETSRYLYRPWLRPGPFRYDSEYVAESIRRLLTDNPNRRASSLPPELVVVNRLLWGLNSVLTALDAEADWAAILYPLIGRG